MTIFFIISSELDLASSYKFDHILFRSASAE
jgi:hypothetical protein